MNRCMGLVFLAGWVAAGVTTGPASAGEARQAVRVDSPNGQARIELTLGRAGDVEGVPRWRAFYKGRPIVLDSRLGIELAGGAGALGGACEIESVKTSVRDELYTVPVGKRSRIMDHCAEAVVALRERAAPGRRWELVLRAYDDGVAFRYRFPAQAGWPALAIAREQTEFALPRDAQAYALPLNSFTTSFEGRYQKKLVREIPKDWLMGLPLLVECPGAGWAGITEANLTDYAGMYLANRGDAPGVLVSRLSPRPDEPNVAVRASLPHDSPWRVVLLGASPGSLIESDVIFNLNAPCAIADTSWIHPGKTTFPWWNDYSLPDVSFRPGLNTATMKHYIDFCAEAGIPYHSLDGYQNIGWYGCQIGPHTPADITKAVPAIDLPEVIRYAQAKGVKLRLWLHWEDVKGQMDRAFPLYHAWGIEGVMLDFMNRDDQEMENFLRDVIVKAAANHLTVTLHGMSKPTGLERTYPNLLNSESVLNLEYDKWDPLGCPPEHQLTVAFTRMLAGPLDFHQGSFRGVPVAQFKPRNTAPLVMGTPAFMLATYVVYENHLPMVADYPAAYRGNPALPMLARIPSTWDDTRCLGGAVGRYIVVARRHGEDWYIGAMNADATARSIEVPLSFLSPGGYRAEIHSDAPDWQTTHRTARRAEQVTAGMVLKAQLEPAGGYVAWLSPLGAKSAKQNETPTRAR
jgi:alpha-glucosidase